MKYYQKPDGSVLSFLANGTQDDLIPAGSIEIPEEQALPILNPSATPAQLLMEFQKSAQAALLATDTTFARIYEAIILGLVTATDPSVIAWIGYRKSLRSEVRATTVGTLPTKPTTYPAGT